MTTPTPTPQTAAQTYIRHARRISSLVDWLRAQSVIHAAKQKADPRNWGYVGDLEELESTLKRALSQMRGIEPHQIDQALSELEA